MTAILKAENERNRITGEVKQQHATANGKEIESGALVEKSRFSAEDNIVRYLC